MQINVVNIIIDSLLANGKCSIDSLGTFILNKDLPKVDSKNKRIEAPQTTVSFEDSIHTDFKLEDELRKVYPFSEDKSKKVVSLFSNKVVNGLINFDHIELRNLGVLKNNKEKTGLAFTLSSTLDEVIKSSQPDVDLKPFLDAKAEAEKKAKKEAEEADRLKKKLEKEEADRKAKAEKLKAEKAAAAMSVKPSQPKAAEPKPNPVKNPIVQETVVPVSSTAVESPVSTQLTPKKAKAAIAPIATKEKEVFIHQDDESFFSKYLPWILFLLLLIGVGWGLKKIVSMISVDSEATEVLVDNDNSESTDETKTDDENSNAETSDSEVNTKEGTGGNEGTATSTTTDKIVKEKPLQPSECIIITGSYLDQQNMDEMASKIRKMGYEVYTEKYGYYTRVGFKFPCQEVNLKLFIEEIRATISKESWYLVPDLSI